MKFDTNQAESQYALLSTNLNAFVIQVLSQYEQATTNLQAQLTKTVEERDALRKKYEPEKAKVSETPPKPKQVEKKK